MLTNFVTIFDVFSLYLLSTIVPSFLLKFLLARRSHHYEIRFAHSLDIPDYGLHRMYDLKVKKRMMG